MPRQRGFRCMRFSPTARLVSGKQQQPVEHFSAIAGLSQRLWLGANSTSPLLLSKASVASAKKSCGRALAFPGSMFASWVHLPGLTKQTQPQPCISVHSLGWHSMHTSISRCRLRLAFYSGAQAASRTRPLLSPPESRGDRILAHRPCTE